MMKIKFWGVRGSIPCPGPLTMKYGGNTACIELRFPELNRLIIIDAGSGLRELGNYMMAHDLPNGPIKTEIYLTHTHWDHIMGFPFFTPLYIPGTKVKVCGPVSYEKDTLEKIVGGQLTYRYFPVREVELGAEIKYFPLKEGSLDLGDGIKLTTKYLNHPILCLGYRFEYKDKVFCTAYDTEPFANVFVSDPQDPAYDEMMAEEGAQVAAEQNQAVENFIAGADLLIHDSQYTAAEYAAGKQGWGHSSIEFAIAQAKRAKVKSLALFHHEPIRTDDQYDALADIYCQDGSADEPRIFFAREGMEIEL
ncbi:MAG: MBL fold metallo-hydrolase [Desulfobulbaceae bacterium]|nr:MAG: MBL fold metallo-hydrolase [Desulfobulbaceae bacterium]